MRVISGELGGRRIEAPPGTSTRPTTDRVREAVFNALRSLALVDDAVVVDLFAGSGAMGLEALSRGAARCTFVERDRNASRVITANVESLGVADRSTVVTGDAVAAATRSADLVLADPPYDFDDWERLVGAVDAPFLVIESGAPIGRLVDAAVIESHGWEVARERRYGRTWVTFLERTSAVA